MAKKHNHIDSAEDRYNAMADLITDYYRAVFPEDDYWDTLTIPSMISSLAEAATYKKKWNELVSDNLKHSQASANNLLQAILEASLIKQREPDNVDIEMVGDMLVDFKEREEIRLGKPITKDMEG